MPDKKGRLTPQERKFIVSMAKTGDKVYSATVAGYKQPQVVGHLVAAKAAIKAEILAAQAAILTETGLPLAVTAHINLLSSPMTPPGAMVQAVKLMYDRTLGAENQGDRREPHEMSGDELAREIERLKREVSERAKPVTLEHEASPTSGLFD